MRFSEAFEIERTPDDDWFDPDLKVDTQLFLDPILLIVAGGEWLSAHDELIAHFVRCYNLVAKATGPTSLSARAARTLLTFPEPSEFCLGYTASGTAGAGSGSRFAQQMADGIAVAIAQGLDVPEHIEEIGILNVGIGADRISDAACNVLKHRFITYTDEVVARHGIATEQHVVRNARVLPDDVRWLSERVRLPTNPATGEPILLLPRRLLNDLPVLNAESWMDSGLNADLRQQLNVKFGREVSKTTIVDLARRHAERVRAWAREQTSRLDLVGYDYEKDPKGVVGWDGVPRAYAETHPINGLLPPQNEDELIQLVEAVVIQFKHFIEEGRGWELLWNDGNTAEKDEKAAQLVFLGMARPYLRLFGVELDREVELGRGPVDFKISAGSRHRLLIEVKKLHTGTFWNGLEAQLPSYLVSDDCNNGWLMAVRYRDDGVSETRAKELPDRVDRCAQDIGKSVHYTTIDGRPKESASKLKRKSQVPRRWKNAGGRRATR